MAQPSLCRNASQNQSGRRSFPSLQRALPRRHSRSNTISKFMYDARLCSYIPPLLLPLQSTTLLKEQTSARLPDTICEEDMPEPNNSELQPNPILHNFRLIFSWPLLFAFTLSPLLGLLGTCFMIGYFDKIRNFYLLAYLALESAMLITLISG